jgi:hypothetical protein
MDSRFDEPQWRHMGLPAPTPSGYRGARERCPKLTVLEAADSHGLLQSLETSGCYAGRCEGLIST